MSAPPPPPPPPFPSPKTTFVFPLDSYPTLPYPTLPYRSIPNFFLTALLLRALGSSASDRDPLSLRLILLCGSFPVESTATTVDTLVIGRIGSTTLFVV